MMVFISVVEAAEPLRHWKSSLDNFMDNYVNQVQGRRVGLITDVTGIDGAGRTALMRFLNDNRIRLTALFVPNQNFYLDNSPIAYTFPGTELVTLPLKTLFNGGEERALRKIDLMIYYRETADEAEMRGEIQQLLNTAKKETKSLIILDRPAADGAGTVDGPRRDDNFPTAGVSVPVPLNSGLTVAEYARMVNGELKLDAPLSVVPMLNYQHGTGFSQLNIPYVAPSLAVPTPEAAICRKITGSLEFLSGISIGLDANLPYQLVVSEYADPDRTAAALEELNLAGIRFLPVRVTPEVGPLAGKKLGGVRIYITDIKMVTPSTAGIAIIDCLQSLYPEFCWPANTVDAESFDMFWGTESVRKALQEGESYQTIARAWEAENERVARKVPLYQLYQ